MVEATLVLGMLGGLGALAGGVYFSSKLEKEYIRKIVITILIACLTLGAAVLIMDYMMNPKGYSNNINNGKAVKDIFELVLKEPLFMYMFFSIFLIAAVSKFLKNI